MKFLLHLDGFLQRMKLHVVLLSFLVYNSFRSSWNRSFQGQHVKWCYVYISCFKTQSARKFICVWMVSSSALFIGQMKTKKPTLLGGACVEICLNEVISPSPSEFLFDASAQSPPINKMVEMLHFSYSRINGANFWTAVSLFNRVVRSKRKV